MVFMTWGSGMEKGGCVGEEVQGGKEMVELKGIFVSEIFMIFSTSYMTSYTEEQFIGGLVGEEVWAVFEDIEGILG